MDDFDDQDGTQLDDTLDAQRKIIRASLNETANDVGMIMRDEGLHFPIYITVRNSGDSLATIATTLDPTDTEWSHAWAIVCEVIKQRTGGGRLRGRELPCAVANAAPIIASDVTAGQNLTRQRSLCKCGIGVRRPPVRLIRRLGGLAQTAQQQRSNRVP